MAPDQPEKTAARDDDVVLPDGSLLPFAFGRPIQQISEAYPGLTIEEALEHAEVFGF